MHGKLSYRELAAMVAMQHDSSVPDTAKQLNGLAAAAELSDADVYFCFTTGKSYVDHLAALRLEEAQGPLRDRAAKGEGIYKGWGQTR